MKASGLRLKLWRLFVLVAAVGLLRLQAPGSRPSTPLELEQAKQWFPAAAKVSPPDHETGTQYVTDAFGDLLGMLLQTLPAAKDIIGYSGPSNVLLVLDRSGQLTSAKLLFSGDTEDHVRRVLEDTGYWDQFLGMPNQAASLRGVSGATLTSSAISRGILRAMGGAERASLLFPYPLELRELTSLFPSAADLQPAPGPLGGTLVLDANGVTLGRVLRTSPSSDPVTGYKGPTDTLIILDPEGQQIRQLRVRDSYETEEYLAIATQDSRFLPAFSGRSIQEMKTFDPEQAGVSGVSGATRTSLAILEGVRRRLNQTSVASPALLRFSFRDGALLAIVVFAGVLTFSSWRGVRWLRWTWNAVLIGYLGLISGDLLSQALLAGWATHGLPWRDLPGLILLALAALLVPLLTGKQLYCHHLCPHGAAQQWLGKLTRRKLVLPPRLTTWLQRLPYLLLGSLFLLLVSGVRLNLAAFEPFDAWIFRASGLASMVLAVIGLVASVFHPLAYCKFGCPTGALLRFLRTSGSQDRFGARDWAALAVLTLGAGLTILL